LETSVRGWAAQGGHTYNIVAGGVYNTQDLKIGQGVVVPHAFYKIVIDENTGQYAGWMFPHVKPYPNLGNDLTKFRMPVSQIQTQAGVQFQIPKGAVELQPGKEWPVDFGALTNQKRKLCGANADTD
jgi:endonuclease G